MNNMKLNIKLIGGRDAYDTAVDEAFTSNCHSPAVRYNTVSGFRVTSALIPMGEGDVWEEQANYSANTGKRLTSAYNNSRQWIVEAVVEHMRKTFNAAYRHELSERLQASEKFCELSVEEHNAVLDEGSNWDACFAEGDLDLLTEEHARFSAGEAVEEMENRE
jgi:hypothetical protein